MSEPQYAALFDGPPVVMGPMAGHSWLNDPKSLFFRMARYKHTARILKGKRVVAEVGCSDGWLSRLVAQEVGSLDLYDFDPLLAEAAKGTVHDILDGPLPNELYDAVYALDVFEHIAPHDGGKFLANIAASLTYDGVAVIGIPSLESQAYASEMSLAGHVNCMTGERFIATLRKHFSNAFLFSLNDECIHTGFLPLSHYFLGVCVR